MKIHEYQAKEILAQVRRCRCPRARWRTRRKRRTQWRARLFGEGASGVVVKAQIHAGGRGKGGGVKVARSREDAERHAKKILGMQLVTHQTGPAGAEGAAAAD